MTSNVPPFKAMLLLLLLSSTAWSATTASGPNGVGVQPLSCAASSPAQRWTVTPTGSGNGTRISPASDPQSCVVTRGTDGDGAVLFTTAGDCSATPALDREWALDWHAPSASFMIKQRGLCVGVQGCCDGGPLALLDCVQRCQPTESSPPGDCRFRFVRTASTGGAVQIVTVASGLCLDAGTRIPRRACLDPGAAALPFCDARRPPDARARDLVARLTLREKAAGVLSSVMVPTSTLDGTPVDYNLRQTAGVLRLGIPPFRFNEAMHGINALCLPNASCPTMFPSQITQAAAFNRTLWRAVATAIGREGRALHNAGREAANFWAPDVNPFRNPLYGRGQETGGEDAYVNGEVATEYVLGLQVLVRADASCARPQGPVPQCPLRYVLTPP